jgi:hypothetical protein
MKLKANRFCGSIIDPRNFQLWRALLGKAFRLLWEEINIRAHGDAFDADGFLSREGLMITLNSRTGTRTKAASACRRPTRK